MFCDGCKAGACRPANRCQSVETNDRRCKGRKLSGNLGNHAAMVIDTRKIYDWPESGKTISIRSFQQQRNRSFCPSLIDSLSLSCAIMEDSRRREVRRVQQCPNTSKAKTLSGLRSYRTRISDSVRIPPRQSALSRQDISAMGERDRDRPPKIKAGRQWPAAWVRNTVCCDEQWREKGHA